MAANPFAISGWESTACYLCGVEFASPLIAERLADKKTFFCPNGHSQHFLGESYKSKAERLEREVISQRSRADKAESRVNQFSVGKCPCCGQKFRRLREHMTKKHPLFPK